MVYCYNLWGRCCKAIKNAAGAILRHFLFTIALAFVEQNVPTACSIVTGNLRGDAYLPLTVPSRR
jgi:hypothetical protein